MYERYFDLSQDPFSIAPDPRFLYMSPRHREALAHLLFGINGSGGIVLLTGDIGTGKTTVCRCFLEQVPSTCKVAIIFNPKLSVLELLQTICQEFQVPMPAENGQTHSVKAYVDALNLYLLKSHSQGLSNVLIIDEAQNLRTEVLEQLRLLTNLETNERKLLQIILIGQPELQPLLAQRELEQLAQRIIARFHLGALTLAETEQYILHRLSIAGLTGPSPFDTKALRRIHELTGGVPRRINLLCGRSLLGAWANGLRAVDTKVIQQAAIEVFGQPAQRWGLFRDVHLSLWSIGLGVLLLAIALGMFISRQMARSQGSPVATSSDIAKAAPTPDATAGPKLPASQAAVPTLPLPQLPKVPPAEISAVWPELSRAHTAALSEIAGLWNIPENGGSPCQSALKVRAQCFRATDMNIPMLRKMGRPGVLVLQLPDKSTAHAALVGLGEHTATLRIAGANRTVSLTSLAAAWQGEFFTFWTPPVGYVSELREGSSGPLISFLATQLATLDGQEPPDIASKPPKLDAALMARVRTFQRSNGLKVDGHPGPMTLMQLERILDNKAPSLQLGDL